MNQVCALLLSLVLPLVLLAQTFTPIPNALVQDTKARHQTPEQIQIELSQAEEEFNQALTLFSPWYTGPLIAPGASMMPPANGNTQPYLFFIDNYAAFDSHRKSISLPSHLLQLKATANIQTGVTDNMDINVNFAAQRSWQHKHSGGGFSDMSATAGFLIYRQSLYAPAAKFTISETFPTGKYKHLDRFALQSTGGGTYATQFGLGFSKVILWNTQHPMNLRCFVGYTLSTVVAVKGFNSYGGGNGCSGKVRPGNSLSCDFGYEVSFTQRWVGAFDLVYTCTNRTKFHGNPGVLSDGSPASVGSGYSDNLSLAPALEYNFNPNLGIIAGGWFSVYGRNSPNFGAAIISVTYSFP